MTKDFPLCQKQIHTKLRGIALCEAKTPTAFQNPYTRVLPTMLDANVHGLQTCFPNMLFFLFSLL